VNRARLFWCMFVGILTGCAIDPRPTPDEMSRIHAMPRPVDQNAAEQTAREWLQANLKDPDSARYGAFRQPVGGVLALPNLNSRGGQDFEHYGSMRYVGWFMCGEVNAKNSYGGYTGFEPFMVWFDPSNPTVARDGWIGDIVADWCRGIYGH
jgi:hypothetical protein